jgi:membrane-associated phospholipid phosphatase
MARARVIWLFVLLIVQGLYFPVNRMAQDGVILSTPWDAAIPLWPIWAVPYLLSIFGWVACIVWAARNMDNDLYQAFAISMLLVMLISYAVYLLYPTYVERPALAGDDWQMELMRFIYGHDRAYNAFPSSHTYNTVLIGLFWRRWYPRWRWLWAGMVIVVLLSTLFTRQHNLPDLIGGALLAWLGYRLGVWWAKTRVRE